MLSVLGPVAAAEPKDKLIYENWEAVYLDGGKAGYFHTTVRAVDREGQKLQHTNLELDLTLKRFGDTLRQHMEVTSDETADGKVTGVSMTQMLGEKQQMVLTGIVEGNQLHVTVKGEFHIDKKIGWNDQVVGLYKQQRLFRDRRVKPGDSFSYLSYEPQVNAVVNVQVTVGNEEEVEVLPGKTKKRLLRVLVTPDKIQGVQLPPLTGWLDKDGEFVRSQIDLPGFGTLVRYRTTREAARAPGRLIDIGQKQNIRLNRSIPHPQETDTVVYRITLKGETDVGTAFAQDGRQEIRNVKGNSLEVHIHAVREPHPKDHAAPVAPEFLKSNYFLNSDDGRVKDLARQAVGREKDPWKRAQLIERWVHTHMRKWDFGEAMATADHVARTLKGDCTEYAMLTAAMCRAVDVPSRTAIGLVYFDDASRRPMMGYHMWTEVWISGQWIPIDATLGQGHIGATHLKVTDHSWCDVHSLSPLLPFLRVMGKVAIEVVRVDEEDAPSPRPSP
jgi:hypothetical protein